MAIISESELAKIPAEIKSGGMDIIKMIERADSILKNLNQVLDSIAKIRGVAQSSELPKYSISTSTSALPVLSQPPPEIPKLPAEIKNMLNMMIDNALSKKADMTLGEFISNINIPLSLVASKIKEL